MKYNKGYLVTIITAAAILIDLLGRWFATKYSLPVWLDSLGTLFIAYLYGPICGGVVGLVNNVIYGIFVDKQFVYCFVGMIIGVLVGILAKKGVFETPFKVMSLGAGLAILCTILAVPINLYLLEGKVGNVWGNQMTVMCINSGLPRIVSNVIAQFYIEFLDKLISVYIVYLAIKLVRGKRMKKKTIASLLLLVFASSCVFGTSTNVYAAGSDNNKAEEDYDSYTHIIYGADEGLLAGEANDIAQTKEGQLWMGTYAGLYSYDGVRFTLYNDIDSIKNVNDLYVDEEGRLWVGTNDNGLTMMINGHVMNVMDVNDGLLSNSVRSITCDSNGNYYIGSSAGVSIVTLSGGVKITKSFPQVQNTIRLTANSTGEVIAVNDGGEVYSFQDGELIKTTISGLANHMVTSAFFTKDDTLYLGMDTDTVRVIKGDAGLKSDTTYTCTGLSTINSFYEMENGEIFICSDSGVGYINNSGTFKMVNTDRFTKSIDNMLVDYQGDLWFSSSRLGLAKMCKSSFTGLLEETAVDQHVVNAVTCYKGNMWCGTDDGLLVIDENKKALVTNEVTELLQGIRIRHVQVDSKDDIWISTTGNGVYKVKAIGNDFDITNFNEENGLPGARVRCVKELSSGEMVAVGDDGVSFIENNKVIKTITAEDGLNNVKSLCVLEYRNKVYVGSDGGGITVIKDHAIEKCITKQDGLSSDVILRMVYDENSDGVFVVTSNGLGYIAPSGEVSYLDQFPYSNNFDIISGQNSDMWVLSSAGIYLASSEKLIANVNTDYELLSSKRGLRSSLVANSHSYVKDGVLYLCCDNDVVKVNIDDYNFSGKSYRMILNSVNVDGHDYEISRTKPLNLKSDANTIVLRPKILNYSLNDPYISYCLEGADSKEKIILLSELESITYGNLKPGKYTFKISVLDSSKENAIESGSYVIIKEMEMYQNWWFKLYTIIVAGLVIIWITWFVTRSRVQKTVLKQKLALEYAEKQIKMGNETILSIARTVDAKDSNTSEHSFRVSQYSGAIAKRYGFDEEKCENIRQMALLHDIGKIGIPDTILNKPAKLDDEEYEIMKSHVVRGGEILKDFTLIENVSVGALYHHERYDGKGYCSGLKGEEIPIEARIIGIADAFDAMTANRVYRKQLDIEFVLDELKRCRGTQFDPNLTDIMLTLIHEGVIDVESLYKKSKEGK